ncbi:acetyl-CoA C-acetyltransferase [Rhodococcus sp. 14C212]|uniref:acetyl-CoA C-acetyltransferase n=1 Tax=Rhodococcus sp. 14C212 TaxID=2711209 RepID=UPI0013EC4DDF|nr:acetyl-CoA C-acetyltransferase [Rhodococcus sp. 14C212]
MSQPVIVSTVRTPIGRAVKGSLKDLRPDDLLAHAFNAALERIPEFDRTVVDDVIAGCAQPAGVSGFGIARVAALLSGMPNVPGVTVNRFCATSLQAIAQAAHAVRAGDGEVFLAGGVETVSQFGHGIADDGPHNPRFAAAEARTAERARKLTPWEPADGLPDYFIDMGQTAENVRMLENVSRSEMDEFAVRSQENAVAAQKRGFFDWEIAPVPLPDGTLVTTDDGPRADTSMEKLSSLKPVFFENGEVTAGNSCPLNDGAAATIVMSEDRARALGLKPLARIVASAATGLNPEIMGLGPVEAVQRALHRADLSIGDIDLVEINEAFAAQVIPSARRLGIPWEKLNVNGGAIALGHPFGMTGSRIMTTLINAMRERGARYGVESMCVGGGQGMAMVVESLD